MGDITIRRDDYGIAHVRAGHPEAAFWGQGFVHGQDRWSQMDLDRRRAYGRLAELLGPVAVPSDQFWRPLAIRQVAAEEHRRLDTVTRAMFQAYADGVNAALARTPHPEYRRRGWTQEPWQPEDALAVFKTRHLLMGVFERKLWWGKVARVMGPDRLLALVRAVSGDSLVIVPPGATAAGLPVELDRVQLPPTTSPDSQQGSNSWVLAGSRTLSGQPILAGDPHREIELPNVYYQTHLACDAFDVIGLSFPGVPGFPHFGHNRHVAWAITHTGADTQDLYLENLRDPDVDFVTDTQYIAVRGQDPVAVECGRTRRGPLLSRSLDETGLALRATALEPVPEQYACLHRMLTAPSLESLFETQRTWVDPVNNFLGADTHGHIGYLMRGRVPLRPVENLLGPVPGSDPRYQWTGFIPFPEWPTVRDPAPGVIVTANNRVTGPDYPHAIGVVFAAEHRARRIWTLLAQRPRDWAPSDMASIHLDVRPDAAVQFARWAERVAPTSALEQTVRDAMASWDGTLVAESAVPLVYNTWRQELTRRVLRGLVGPELVRDADPPVDPGAGATFSRLRARLLDLWAQGDPQMVPPGTTWDEQAEAAFHQAVEALTAQYGSDPARWHWGDVHRVVVRHALSETGAADGLPSIDAALPGDSDSVRAASYGPTGFAVTGASVARYVFAVGNWDASLWIVPGGVQEVGPHALDQLGGWLQGVPVPMWYSEEAVAAHTAGEETIAVPDRG